MIEYSVILCAMQVLPWLGCADPGSWVNGFPCMPDGGSTWDWLLGKHQDAKKAKKKIIGWSPPKLHQLSLFCLFREWQRMLIQEVDHYDNRRITLEGGQWGIVMGAEGILENCLSFFSQLVAHRQQSSLDPANWPGLHYDLSSWWLGAEYVRPFAGTLLLLSTSRFTL